MTATATTTPASKLTAPERKKMNSKFVDLCKVYHNGIPLKEIEQIFEPYGLALEGGIYCGDGESFEPVGRGAFFRLSWYKMQSGKFEIVCYLS